jgi:hypothetical protein
MRRFAAALATGLFTLTIATPAFATDFDLQCMQRAVEKRESAFINSFDTYYASVRTAMISRKDALKNAWGISDSTQRKEAIKTAGKNFATSEKNARKVRRDADKAAAKTYKTEAEACEI